MKTRFYIGIDPGKKTGYAVWDSEEKEFVTIGTITFWKVVVEVDKMLNYEEYYHDIGNNLTVVVEMPGRFLYARHRNVNHKTELNIAHKSGGTYREAELLIERFESLGLRVIAVRPSKKSQTKLTAETFKRLTGYTARTSEHGRDAAMLVFGG